MRAAKPRLGRGWTRGRFPDGKFIQKVGIVTGDSVVLLPLNFSAHTGALTDESRAMLETRSYRPMLEGEAERKKLPSAERWRRELPASGQEQEEAVDLDTAIEQCEDEREREELLGLAKMLRQGLSMDQPAAAKQYGLIQVGAKQ